MARTVIILVVSLMASAASAGAQAPGGSIGVYADLAGTSSEITVPYFVPTDFYILGRPNIQNLNGGIFGAEFRVKGAPPVGLLVVSATPNPAATVSLGSPFSDESQPDGSKGGCNIAFEECQTPDGNGIVLLYTVTAVDIAVVSDVYLEVDKKDPPSNPSQAPFPLFIKCNPPQYTALEVDGLMAVINRSSISVEGREWGAVKGLYR